ncbi:MULTISPECIES: hypothetical protein [Pseudonocardia]|uniref:N-acetyltransferase domain-containing protein n=2 Tax=Pseudonocardia TaxID=1847 RepID=A0A1Y2N8Y5_PSEAH|nr:MULTISPECIES: hypothetical protein [Pseudonocardia]OSY43661.1 hypothetical protein BG845_00607 [Pseudonocardia autotrophica]TDN73349.1 hypothetical protein C8E95_2442 [Pseudonocardia autotrophica]BBG04087.1 hypothetical protein Pdca_52960 [Pseudonocardia autotrophica]GEC26224.1 hypothetical protein PSA01_32530 [Pseudonocardia saturnea]
MTGRIRAYRVEDAKAVIGLHRATLLAGRAPAPSFARYLSSFYGGTLFDHPWLDDELTSLVYEEADGRVIGFVGVIPRPMLLDDRPVRAAVSVRFMVSPDHPHAALAAAALHRRFLRGPQDLSLVENANDAARRVWQGTRNACVLPNRSISWSIAAPGDPDGAPVPGPGLDPETLSGLIRTASARYRIRPRYDEKSTAWLLDFLAAADYRGSLHGRAVTGRDGEPLGWYLYYRRPAGSDTAYNGVLQLMWDHDPAPVLDQLLADAGGSGSPVVGRLDDALLPHVADRGAQLAAGPWTVVHSPDPRIVAAFRSGEAYLTRLEGEFC